MPGGNAPTRLPRDGGLAVLILEGDVKHFSEVLAEVVAGGSLDGPAAGWDVGLAGGGLVASSEPGTSEESHEGGCVSGW